MIDTAAVEEDSSQGYPMRWIALAIILVSEVMDLLDSTIVNIAAPSIRDDIGGTYSDIQWFAAAYTLAYAIGLIMGGRMGDIFGRRRMFIIGATGFMIASIACSLANTADVLIIARVVQGAAGALLIPQGMGMIRAMFTAEERPKAFALFGPVMGLSAVLGPIIAGGLIDLNIFNSGWRSVFWINVPLGLVSIVGAIKILPHAENHEKVTLDIWGAVLTAAAMFLLVFPLVQGREAGWPLWTYGMIVLSMVLFGVFTWHELRVERSGKSPLIVPGLFRKRQFNSGLIFCALFFAAMSGLFLTLGLYCQIGLGFSPLRAGFTQAPIAFGIAVGAAATGSLTFKLGRTLMMIGLAFMLAGIVLLLGTFYLFDTHMTIWKFIPSLFVIGIGLGQVFSPLFSTILAAVTDKETGSASGTINAVQQFGGTLGVALVATLFFSMISSQAPHGANDAADKLNMQLTELNVPAVTTQQIDSDFTECLQDRTTQKDASDIPASCERLNQSIGSIQQYVPSTGEVVGNQAIYAVKAIFTDAIKHTMWLPILMVVIAIGSGFFMPRRPRAGDNDH